MLTSVWRTTGGARFRRGVELGGGRLGIVTGGGVPVLLLRLEAAEGVQLSVLELLMTGLASEGLLASESAVEQDDRFGFLPWRRPGGPQATGKCSPDAARRRASPEGNDFPQWRPRPTNQNVGVRRLQKLDDSGACGWTAQASEAAGVSRVAAAYKGPEAMPWHAGHA
jgi:hypothetical protein